MKKQIIVAAIAAAVGISAFLGFRPATESELSELQLANAEALTNDEELPPAIINCVVPNEKGGNCHVPDTSKEAKNCGGLKFYPCKFNGNQFSICSSC